MNRIDNIISEEINKAFITEGKLDFIADLLKDFVHKTKSHKKHDHEDKKDKHKSKEEIRKDRKRKKKAEKDKRGRKKLRKLVNGGSRYYDYNDYERKHKKLSKGDTESITDTIDQNNTDIAAVAREVFPDHTKTGAQSQLRKILNHERPMTKDVASKLDGMISKGKVAVK